MHPRPSAELGRIAREVLRGARRSGRLMAPITECEPPVWRFEALPGIAQSAVARGSPLGEEP